MYDICHPSFYHIGKLGCKDHIKVTVAYHVYIELCEVKKLWDVGYEYNEALDLIYLKAKKQKDSNSEVYIPWPETQNITPALIDDILHKLHKNRVIFVFKGEDNSSVFYTVSEGLVKLPSPEVSKGMKLKEEKKLSLEKEIRRNTSNLHELAKSCKHL